MLHINIYSIMSKSRKQMSIYSLSEKKHYDISLLKNVETIKTANGRYRLQGVTPSGKVVSRFISKQMAGSGLLGNLFQTQNGELWPGSSQIPLLGALL